MNKYRKAESRRAKAMLRSYQQCGEDFTYKQVRRMNRKFERAVRNLSKNMRRRLHKGIKRCDYHVSKAVRDIGMRVPTVTLDEMHTYREVPND